MDRYPFFDFWHFDTAEILKRLSTSSEGLSSDESIKRLNLCKRDHLKKFSFPKAHLLFLNQFKSPLSLLLLVCALLAFFLSDKVDAWIILSIILISGLMGMLQETKAQSALKRLIRLVDITIPAERDHKTVQLSTMQLVPGDVIHVQAGDPIPSDCIVLESHHLFVNESTLTGESTPIEKIFSKHTTPDRSNILWMGTHVMSGFGKAVVVNIGLHTEYGKLTQHVSKSSTSSSFEKGVFHLGVLLIEVTFILVIVIFAINMLFKRDLLQSFLFSLALGVGLTPQLLPMILTVTLAKGACFLAKQDMITKKLSALENLGSMNTLCCDKTGTLTEGVMTLNGYCNLEGYLSPKVLELAQVSAHLQSGFKNPFDQAILSHPCKEISSWKKLDELPFDFTRKRVSHLVHKENSTLLITKGDFSTVLPLCSYVENTVEGHTFVESSSKHLLKLQQLCAEKTIKLLAVAYKKLPNIASFTEADESAMTFCGYLEFLDPIKESAQEELNALRNLGIDLKIISGDNYALVKQLGKQLGFQDEPMQGSTIDSLSDTALASAVEKHALFAEVHPLNKERLIHALKSHGRIVGFLGDGINDCAAMQLADVSISVDQGTKVAKETADFIMTRHSLTTLKDGVLCGRKTFANTLKYIFMATSANFGNMFSMAFSSLILPFLPFLPKQILLINLLTDIPEFAISSDHVDKDWLISPKQWNFSFIKKFMVIFGLLSSFFDFTTFLILKFLGLSIIEFRTAWFLESILSAACVLLVIRTKHPLTTSLPSLPLILSVLGVIITTFYIPYSSIGLLFGLCPLQPFLLSFICLIVIFYIAAAEITKKIFYNKLK